jgi:hypothetical protein
MMLKSNKILKSPDAASSGAPARTLQAVVGRQRERAKGSCGNINITNVPPKTAAMLMAIVADEMKAPLNELRFISIKQKGSC